MKKITIAMALLGSSFFGALLPQSASSQTAVDCRLTSWSAWRYIRTIPEVCRNGQMERREYRSRGIITPASNGGTCPPREEREEWRPFYVTCGGVTPPPPTPVNCQVSDWSAWAPSPWGVCSSDRQTRVETRSRYVTVQPANGGNACPSPLSETRTVAQTCDSSRTARLSWETCSRNTDGSALTNLAGTRIFYGRSAGEFVRSLQIATPSATAWTITDLDPATWYFVARCYNSEGVESANSNQVTKIVR